VKRGPRVEKCRDATFLLRSLPPSLVLALRELPLLVADDGAGLRGRHEGSPYPGDPAGDEHWEKRAVPELRHLYEEARSTVLRDLQGLEPETGLSRGFRLAVPAEHLPAWLSTLAAARVGLGDRHGVTEAEMEVDLPAEIRSERDRAVLLIHLLGWIQGLLVEAGA
jgi:hypothetical protein